jgi:membrane protein YdbS with pleckstrin-like domain
MAGQCMFSFITAVLCCIYRYTLKLSNDIPHFSFMFVIAIVVLVVVAVVMGGRRRDFPQRRK